MWRKENITLSSKILINHFTGVQKIITLCFIILMLSFINIINISALSYQNEVGIGFTFNPTLSVSLSSSDLIISNLTPDSSGNSNSINVSVATNAAYGYTLFATVGDNTHNNSNLAHSNNTNIFSSVATNADLAILTTDNTWGYSTSLDNGSSWSNYNGLSSSTSTTLIDNSNTVDSTDSIDFKIGAKASNTQASGIYTNTINFIAVSKVAPMSLLDSFIASGAEQYNGYFKMQDMTHDICEAVDVEESELQLIDVRDNKVYWVAKLKDGNCWMTQNLDLAGGTVLNTDYSDVDSSYIESFTTSNNLTKTDNTIVLPASSASGFNTNNYAYIYNSRSEICGDNNPCYSYYSWDAATLGSGRNITNGNTDAPYSICPKEWRLPNNRTNVNSMSDFRTLVIAYGGSKTIETYDNNTVPTGAAIYNKVKVGTATNFSLAGYYASSSFGSGGVYGYYWSSNRSRNLVVGVQIISSNNTPNNRYGFSVRCLAR